VKNNTLVIFLLLGVLSSQASETEVTGIKACEAVKWPYAKKQSKKDLAKLLHSMELTTIEAYFLYELTQEKLEDDLGKLLGFYLSKMETREGLKGLYETLADTLESRLKDKDQKPPSLKEICEIKKQVIEAKVTEEN